MAVPVTVFAGMRGRGFAGPPVLMAMSVLHVPII